MSKAEEFARDICAGLKYPEEGNVYMEIKNTFLEYGRLVQEAAAKETEGWADLKDNEGAYGTGVRDGVKFSAKAIREMPLP